MLKHTKISKFHETLLYYNVTCNFYWQMLHNKLFYNRFYHQHASTCMNTLLQLLANGRLMQLKFKIIEKVIEFVSKCLGNCGSVKKHIFFVCQVTFDSITSSSFMLTNLCHLHKIFLRCSWHTSSISWSIPSSSSSVFVSNLMKIGMTHLLSANLLTARQLLMSSIKYFRKTLKIIKNKPSRDLNGNSMRNSTCDKNNNNSVSGRQKCSGSE